MKIYVDADACPVTGIIERLAREYKIPCILLCDTNHIINSDYSEVIIVGAGADAVDFKLVSLIKRGDICVTQDYGVAAMILGKGAYGIHQSGKWYTNENIDQLLMQRHITKKVRRSSKKNHLKGPAKRTVEDDLKFEESLKNMIEKVLTQEE
ncbi:MAG: YaiI/YqxD family protein [Eubacteriales bacterium]|nr:YaiI/YqxD family protein [Eubacteriales bacterium]